MKERPWTGLPNRMDANLGSACYRILGLLAGALLTAAPFGDGGYLTIVGPKPLRFAAPPARRDPAKVLPALDMDLGPQTNLVEEFGPQPLPDYAAAGIDEEWIGPNIPEGSALNPGGPARQITPDTLLQFFPTVRGSNTTIITSPIDFTPPPPAPSRGSSATYLSK